MNAKPFAPVGLLALAVMLSGSSCPTIPKIEDRIVELAVNASASQEFVGQGSTTSHDDTQAYDLSQIDVSALLDDAGIEAKDVKDLKLAGVEYRVTQIDVNTPNQAISNGNVMIKRGAGSEVALVSNFTLDPLNSATHWATAPLQSPGVGLINQLLTEELALVRDGTPLSGSSVVSVHVTGNAVAPEDFKYEIKLNISITGKVKIKVLN